MGLDDLSKECVRWACVDFVRRINPDEICRLASSFNHDLPCQLDGDSKQGTFNVSFQVLFTHPDTQEQERWMVRFPLLPRLAFPEEKLRGEIATMKYVAEHTTIPLPKVYGYGFGGDYPTGLPFVLLEYIHGHTLIDAKYNTLDPARKRYLYRQLADIFIQLRQLEFDHMGALTLDEHGNPAFTNNRPLGIDFNDDQVDGQDPARMLKPHDVFTSTKASVRYLMKQAFHNYLRQRDAVGNEGNAKNHLYALHRMRDRALAWVDSRYDKGPFILMHGDLLPANIMVDADVRVLAVLDWEWSQTVPLQLLVPPYWLSGLRLELIGYKINIAAIAKEWSCLAESVGRTEEKWACRALARPLVSELWADVDHETMDSIFMAHALLNLDNMSSIYVRRFHYRDDDRREQFNRIFDMASNSTAQEYLSLVARKVEERKRVRIITDDLDCLYEAMKRPRSPMLAMSNDDERLLGAFTRAFDAPRSWTRMHIWRQVSTYWFCPRWPSSWQLQLYVFPPHAGTTPISKKKLGVSPSCHCGGHDNPIVIVSMATRFPPNAFVLDVGPLG